MAGEAQTSACDTFRRGSSLSGGVSKNCNLRAIQLPNNKKPSVCGRPELILPNLLQMAGNSAEISTGKKNYRPVQQNTSFVCLKTFKLLQRKGITWKDTRSHSFHSRLCVHCQSQTCRKTPKPDSSTCIYAH